MAGYSATFQPVEGSGWRRGLGNLLRWELARWWGTRRWWLLALLWMAIAGGLIGMFAFTARAVPEVSAGPEEARQLLGLVGVVAAIGVIILMQGALVGEKESGIAGWILSKPVSRPAYVLSKLLGNAAGVLVSVILAPGAVAYLMLSRLFAGEWLPPLNFLGALGIIGLEALFYLSLALMLGAFSSQRGLILAVPLALVFLQQPLIGLVPPLFYALPYSLSAALAGAAAFGEPLPFLAPLLATGLWSAAFIAAAIWRFGREEF
jgi:ABC-type transport system involved in multi-copper enzyme maturation permease subunit